MELLVRVVRRVLFVESKWFGVERGKLHLDPWKLLSDQPLLTDAHFFSPLVFYTWVFTPGKRLQIVLPRTAEPVTLGHLRHEIASITSLPYDKIKLIHRGLVMRDDRLPLRAYGLCEGSRIGLVGSREEGDKPGAKTSAGIGALSVGEQKARERKAKEADTSEAGLMGRITEALQVSRTELFPEVEKVEHQLEGGASNASAQSTSTAPEPASEAAAAAKADKMTPAQIADAHRRLSELLLRQLLALDSVNVNSDTTRQARKMAVKEVQSHLDRLDAAVSKFKSQQ